MSADLDKLQQAITDLVPKLLMTMEAFEQAQRNLHPTHLQQLGEFIQPFEAELKQSFADFETVTFPEDLAQFGDMIMQGVTYALRACDGLSAGSGEFSAAMKATRAHIRAQEHIYPLAQFLSPVNKYFVEANARENVALLTRTAEGMANPEPGNRGILAANNERHQRGGFTLYVPEYLDNTNPVPLVIALHGGTGHGADFLWAWLREARTRGFMLLSPTSQGDTWSLMGEEHDLAPLLGMLSFVRENFPLDEQHVLLTGMSDGGTYSLMAGCQENSPFTHLAPFSGVLHPDLVMTGQIRFAANRPVYLVHGTEDWMFPIETAYMAENQLVAAGAEVTFRKLEGLSHTFARTEIPNLLKWFCQDLELG